MFLSWCCDCSTIRVAPLGCICALRVWKERTNSDAIVDERKGTIVVLVLVKKDGVFLIFVSSLTFWK